MIGLGNSLIKRGYAPLVRDVVISEMESLIEWDEYINCTASVDTVTYISGIGSLKLIRSDVREKVFKATYDYSIDLSNHRNLNYYMNIADKSELDNIKLILFTSAEKTESSSYISSLISASVTNGWNTISTTLSDYVHTGIATLKEIKAIQFKVTMI